MSPFLHLDDLQEIYRFTLSKRSDVNSHGDLFSKTFGDPDFFHEWHNLNGGSTEVQISSWKGDDCHGDMALYRRQEFLIKVAATKTRCVEEHRWLAVKNQTPQVAWRLEARNRLVDLLSDTLTIEFAIEIILTGNAFEIQCLANVHFSRQVPFLSGQILRETLAKYRTNYGNLELLMKRRCSSRLPRSDMSIVSAEGGTAVIRDLLSCRKSVIASFEFVSDLRPDKYLAVRNAFSTTVGVLSSSPPECLWRIAPANHGSKKIINSSRAPVTLQNVATGKFLGHGLSGKIKASAMTCRQWEVFELEYRSYNGRVALIDVDWHFQRGAYLSSDGNSSEIRCSHDERSPSGAREAIEFILRPVQITVDNTSSLSTKKYFLCTHLSYWRGIIERHMINKNWVSLLALLSIAVWALYSITSIF